VEGDEPALGELRLELAEVGSHRCVVMQVIDDQEVDRAGHDHLPGVIGVMLDGAGQPCRVQVAAQAGGGVGHPTGRRAPDTEPTVVGIDRVHDRPPAEPRGHRGEHDRPAPAIAAYLDKRMGPTAPGRRLRRGGQQVGLCRRKPPLDRLHAAKQRQQ
jgi:hypothetical protein